MHLTRIGTSSLTVAANRSANVTFYKLFVSKVKDDLYYNSLSVSRSTRSVARSTAPAVTVSGLPYATVPYYYRFAATNGSNMRLSDIHSAGLRPAVPSNVRIVNSKVGLYLTWSPVRSTGFTIIQSTDKAMTQNRRVYNIRGYNTGFTPYGLQKGHPYYFRVRSSNGTTKSLRSTEVSATAATAEQSVRVLTYNLLTMGFDGTRNSGEVVAPWNTQRKPAAVALIKAANPDVIGVEEAAAWAYEYRGARQVDTLRSALGSTYSLATTEIPPSDPTFVRTGDYIIYRNTTFAAYGKGGHFSIGDGLFAAYQVLQNRATQARFLVVDTHLRAGRGDAYDLLREAQTKTVVTQARLLARGLPIMYVGDFNSYLSAYHPNDGPTRVTQPAHLAEAWSVAQSVANQQYNTVNLYQRIVSRGPAHIDRIFGELGVAMRTWNQLVKVSNGSFVGVIPSDHNPIFADMTVRY